MAELPLSDGARERQPGATSPLTPSGLVALPERWESERSASIPPHTPETVHLDMTNVLDADRLNGIARFALERASFLWQLSEQGRSVTLQPEQLSLLADAFETIGANLGDGVGGLPARDEEDAPAALDKVAAEVEAMKAAMKAELRAEMKADSGIPF